MDQLASNKMVEHWCTACWQHSKQGSRATTAYSMCSAEGAKCRLSINSEQQLSRIGGSPMHLWINHDCQCVDLCVFLNWNLGTGINTELTNNLRFQLPTTKLHVKNSFGLYKQPKWCKTPLHPLQATHISVAVQTIGCPCPTPKACLEAVTAWWSSSPEGDLWARRG